MNKIAIEFNNLSLEARLNESPTAQQIYNQLPVKSRTSIWGDEIYFEIPLDLPQEPDARQEVEIGELGYWPVGRAFCIFFGPTPVSIDERPRAYSPVNVIGKVLGDLTHLSSIKDGEPVEISRLIGEQD